MPVEPGQHFGNYHVIRPLGEGGFGAVYLVENPLIRRRAAVKVLHSALAADVENVQRFINEARAASAIRHPNIIDVLDAGSTPEGVPYILMEFLEGVSLEKRLADRGRLTLPEILGIAGQAGSALAAAHATGIVHRDLKPANVFLAQDMAAPGGERVKVLDFGIAKMHVGGTTAGGVRTRTGSWLGSPAYMSPEQCRDSADVDQRSDIYSFATMLYEMLAGRTPYVAEAATDLIVMHVRDTPRPIRELLPDVPVPVEATIMRGLARERDHRYDSMASFMTSLLGGEVSRTMPLPQPVAPGAPPAAPVGRGAEVAKTAALPSRTTFSRASGELAVAASDEKRKRTWRRLLPPIVAGAAASLVLLVLMLLKSNQEPPRGTTTVAGPPPVARPARIEPSEPPLPAAFPGRLDAGVPPAPTAVVALPPPKPERAATASTATARRPRRQAVVSAPAPLPAPKRDQASPVPRARKVEDVAGF